MASGGYRVGAGRPKKSVTEKILNGNPGKKKLVFWNLAMKLRFQTNQHLG